MKREYILKRWDNGRWREVARAGTPYGFDAQEGDVGDDWTIDCACGASSVFHGCGSHLHDAEHVQGDDE